MRFTAKRVLVTGAESNTGLGIARRFAEEGATVALHGVNAAATADAAERIGRDHHTTVLPLTADFTQDGTVEAMFAEIRGRLGGLDVLVNNAVDQAVGYSFVDTPPSFLAAAILVNLVAPFRCAQLAANLMIAEGGGAIVNLGSNTAERAIRNRSAYVATKGSVEALTRSMAVELGPRGVRVNAVVPGYIFTERWVQLPAESAARRRANLPLGREASARDIANAVLFLASDEARSITGTRLVVDGGALAQLLPRDTEK